jgi:hypothetical protein
VALSLLACAASSVDLAAQAAPCPTYAALTIRPPATDDSLAFTVFSATTADTHVRYSGPTRGAHIRALQAMTACTLSLVARALDLVPADLCAGSWERADGVPGVCPRAASRRTWRGEASQRPYLAAGQMRWVAGDAQVPGVVHLQLSIIDARRWLQVIIESEATSDRPRVVVRSLASRDTH